MKTKRGTSRFVLIFRYFVIKVPLSFKGLKANIKEQLNSGKPGLCPIYLFCIMPNCTPVKANDLTGLFKENNFCYKRVGVRVYVSGLKVEYKDDSFGWYKGNIVAIDYGN